MNTTHQITIKETKMKITTSTLFRLAGLSAMAAGILFVVIQMIHPPEILSSVTTNTWVIVHYMSIAMCLLGMIGLTGIYIRQVKEAGWLGLTGYLLYSLFFALTMAFVFVEALISPMLAAVSPKFVEGLLGVVSSTASEINLGAIPTIYILTGLLYMLGGVAFGTATFRAGILPRWAGVVLAIGTMLPVVLPHDLVRLAAVPVGLGLAWLGYVLLSERREKASEPLSNAASPHLRQAGAK